MSTPKISVMMTVYNGERFLHEAIESVLSQTFSDFQLLIVDDGSTDGTQDIIRKYDDSRIRFITNTTNRGVSFAREQALQSAHGDYIAVLDADDIAYPERLALQIDYLEEHPDVGLVGSAYEIIDEEGKNLGVAYPPADPVTVRWNLLFHNCICNSTAVYRRNLAIDVGGYFGGYIPNAKISEDYDLWTRLAAVVPIAQLTNVLVKWREWKSHSKSFTATERKEVDKKMLGINIRSIQQCSGRDISPQVAACFVGSTTVDAFPSPIVYNACQALTDCAMTIAETQAQSISDRRHLFRLMMPDLLRVSRSGTGNRCQLLRLGFLYCLRYAPFDLLCPIFMIFCTKVLVPDATKRILRHLFPIS